MDGTRNFLELDDVDNVVDCILRTFIQDSDDGINWPIFDIVFDSAVCVKPTTSIRVFLLD